MDKICKNCKFWTKSVPEDVTAFTPNTRTLSNTGQCSSEKYHITYYAQEMADDEVIVEADEGWGFFTGPLFGCVHFEEKKDE